MWYNVCVVCSMCVKMYIQAHTDTDTHMIKMWMWNVKMYNTYNNLRWLEITNYRIMTERFIELNVWTCTHLKKNKGPLCLCGYAIVWMQCVRFFYCCCCFRSFHILLLLLLFLSLWSTNCLTHLYRNQTYKKRWSYKFFSLPNTVTYKYTVKNEKNRLHREITRAHTNLIGINEVGRDRESESEKEAIHEMLKHIKWNVLI